MAKIGDEVMVPNGYYPNGDARAWIPGTKVVPADGVRQTPAELNQDAALMDCLGIQGD